MRRVMRACAVRKPRQAASSSSSMPATLPHRCIDNRCICIYCRRTLLFHALEVTMDVGLLLIHLTVGSLLFAHGVFSKLLHLDFQAGYMEAIGLRPGRTMAIV